MRRFIGSWRCPSGNSLDVFLDVAAGDCSTPTDLVAEWDTFPPSKTDARYYMAIISPQIGLAVQRELGRRVLWVIV